MRLGLNADRVTDLAEQQEIRADGGELALRLEPYQLRSFAAGESGRIKVLSIAP